MKKFYLLICAAATLLNVSAQNKINPQGMVLIDGHRALQASMSQKSSRGVDAVSVVVNPEVSSQTSVTALVKLTAEQGVAELESAGATVISVRNNVAIAILPFANIDKITALPMVKSIEFGEKMLPKLNKARAATETGDVQTGTGLSQSYTGAGVIAGLYDTGLDPNHVNFEGRVKRVWKVTGSSADPTVIEYATPERIASFTTDDASETHGTHVLGIMAGAYNGSGTYATYTTSGNVTVNSKPANKIPYYGAATGADIAIGCGDFYDYAILRGCEKIIDYAKSEGKPAVINLSIGTNVGPHDGTSAFNEYLAGLGEDAVICVAAGNEGTDNVSIQKTFASTSDALKTFISPGTSGYQGVIEFWGPNSTQFTPSFVIYDTTTSQIVYSYEFKSNTKGNLVYVTDDSYTGSSYIHDDNFNNAVSGYIIGSTNVDPSNNRYNFYLQTRFTVRDARYVPGIMVTGPSGMSIDGFTNLAFTNRSLSGWQNGNSECSISDMACGANIISVGSFNSRNSVARMNAGQYQLTASAYEPELISPFSSYGVTFDGRSLPDICAPGCTLVSSYSTPYCSAQGITGSSSASSKTMTAYAESTVSGKSRDNYWSYMMGTSMATPFLAGTCVLMLEADPTLDVHSILDILKKTAVAPESRSANTQWGAGKLNTYEAVKDASISTTSIGKVFDDDEQRFFLEVTDGSVKVFVAGATNVDAQLVSMSGAVVKSVSASGNEVTVPTAGLAKGVYVLSVRDEESVYTRKIVVK